MTSFEDGPAKGQHLLLERTVRFLRVVEAAGKWDALDQSSDSPRPDERCFAYELVSKIGVVHVNRGRGRGGFYTIATYRFVAEQPSDATMRNQELWEAWCEAKQ